MRSKFASNLVCPLFESRKGFKNVTKGLNGCGLGKIRAAPISKDIFGEQSDNFYPTTAQHRIFLSQAPVSLGEPTYSQLKTRRQALWPLFHLFSVFSNKPYIFLQQINVKKCHVHPVYGAGIRTHDLRNVSLLP